jgi:hypothetical protein
MIKKQIEVRAYLDPTRNYAIRLFGYSQEGDNRSVVDDVIMKDVGRYDSCNSFLDIEKSQAQVLMDDLWSCGIRPSEGSGSAGSLAATQKHLDDMRTISFSVLKILKPTE